jgi:hypothetical protein
LVETDGEASAGGVWNVVGVLEAPASDEIKKSHFPDMSTTSVDCLRLIVHGSGAVEGRVAGNVRPPLRRDDVRPIGGERVDVHDDDTGSQRHAHVVLPPQPTEVSSVRFLTGAARAIRSRSSLASEGHFESAGALEDAGNDRTRLSTSRSRMGTSSE